MEIRKAIGPVVFSFVHLWQVETALAGVFGRSSFLEIDCQRQKKNVTDNNRFSASNRARYRGSL